MKDRIITETHYNYANKFVKILGFDDLADYGRQVGYTVLKESQDAVCIALNKTLDVFKALFPQDGFNLRKIHYKFENIDQVLGFFKKVMTYLGIPHETIRVRGAFYLRLIPQKTSLYNEYIYRMQEKREMPQKKKLESNSNLASGKEIKLEDSVSPWFESTIEPDKNTNKWSFSSEACFEGSLEKVKLTKEESKYYTSDGPHLCLPLNEEVTFGPEAMLPMGNPAYDKSLDAVEDNFVPKSNPLNDCIKFSAILQKENYPVSRIYLTGPEINLSDFKEFKYISSIEVFGLECSKPYPLHQGTEIIAKVGGTILQKQIVSNPIESGSGFIFNLDFPNSFFYEYHKLQLQIKNTRFSLFQINMKGKNFLKKYPTNKFIITDHDPKYYNPSRGYEWRIAHGMCGCSIWDENTQTSINYEDILKSYFSNNQVTQLKEIYQYPNPIEFNGLEIANKDNLESDCNLGLMLLVMYPNLYKSHCSFILINTLTQLKFSFIESYPAGQAFGEGPTSSIHSLYYSIERSCDAIAKIEIPENFVLNYQVTISLFDGTDLVPVGTFDSSNRSVRLEQFYYLISRGSRDTFLVIQVPSSELYQWLQINLIFGQVYLDSPERRHVAQNPGFIN
jgi:hypothetical protein